jgi:hypothetical protein
MRRHSTPVRSSAPTAVNARGDARRSNGAARRAARTYVSGLLVLAFLAAFIILAAWREVQTLFGV